ncbi:MAG: GldG family protein, partial [Victivallaceae bacterium]
MKTSIKTVIAVVFVLITMFCSAWLAQSFFKDARLDVTSEKIYTISQGSKNILAKLNQPITIKLFYARTAALKGPDQIKFFNDYYEFVSSLLKEYVKAGNGMIKLEIIDPRPYSDEEAEALRYGLRKFPISAEENFFFGLAVKTQFGVTKTLEFFSLQRERFVEYDISSLIDSAISRRKSKLGVMSSLSITGSNMSPYMLQMMRMQGQQPAMPWGIIEQLKQKYEIVKIAADVEKIEGVDMLLVVHPKKLPEKTLFAIDR